MWVDRDVKRKMMLKATAYCWPVGNTHHRGKEESTLHAARIRWYLFHVYKTEAGVVGNELEVLCARTFMDM